MLRLAAECGLRRAEVAQVHTRDLVDVGGITQLVVKGKGGKRRVMPVSSSLAELLCQGAAGHTPGAPARGWLFPNGVGGRLTDDHIGGLVAASTSRRLDDAHPSSQICNSGLQGQPEPACRPNPARTRVDPDHREVHPGRRRRDPRGSGMRVVTQVTSHDELSRLPGELLARFEAHPANTWSPRLLAAVAALLDVEFEPTPEPHPGFRPYLVSK